jgi:hypothetical protein
MKKLLFLFLTVSLFSFGQTNDCEDCVVLGGFYCGTDTLNWTQYSPNGCVQASWMNDGWLDCVDGSDENGALPTTMADCQSYEPEPCDTVFVTDTVMVYVPEYIDCDTGLPCTTSIVEIIENSKNNNKMYNLLGIPILRPRGVYIQNGELKYKIY